MRWRFRRGWLRGMPWVFRGNPPTVPMPGPPQFHCRHCKHPLGRRDRVCPECGTAVR